MLPSWHTQGSAVVIKLRTSRRGDFPGVSLWEAGGSVREKEEDARAESEIRQEGWRDREIGKFYAAEFEDGRRG